jgi:hypothetical protein
VHGFEDKKGQVGQVGLVRRVGRVRREGLAISDLAIFELFAKYLETSEITRSEIEDHLPALAALPVLPALMSTT